MAHAEADPQMVSMAEEEHEAQLAVANEEYEHLRTLLLTADPNDDRDVVVEIRAGTGGDEAALFGADLFVQLPLGAAATDETSNDEA